MLRPRLVWLTGFVWLVFTIWTPAASGIERYPPWVHDQPKPNSPSAPPWVGASKCNEKSPYAPPWVGRTKTTVKSPSQPPWVGECSNKSSSPYHPPWIGSPCHQPELSLGGVWAYPVDWRDVDWSQADSGASLHQSTQAFSLKWEALVGKERPIETQDPILEYYRIPSPTGPGRIVK